MVVMGSLYRVMLAVTVLGGVAAADPPASSASGDGTSATATTPLSRKPPTAPLLSFDTQIPPPPAPSLRLEALRVAGERADNDWRYPVPAPIGAFMNGDWYLGWGYYRPTSRRSAALHGGAMGATLLGEILVGTGSPLAGVGAMLTGATLDAAAADTDRDAEARGDVERAKQKRKKKHH